LEKLIVTRPAYFDSEQTSCLEEAAIGAGYQAVELIREPEAAAIAYKDLIDFSTEPLVMVIDWGAGTLDFFIAHFFLEDGHPKIAPATPAFGDTRLGGIDMDDALLRRFKDLHRLDLLGDCDEAHLRAEIEKAKIALSDIEFITRFFAAEGVQLPLNFVRSRQVIPRGQDSAQWVCLEETFRDKDYEKEKYEGGILGKFKDNLRFTLAKHKLTTRDIEQLLLIGGPMYMPCVWTAIREAFADNPQVLEQLARYDSGFPVNPFEAVARGAIMCDEVDLGAARSAYTYGFMVDGKLLPGLVIPRGTPIARGSQQVTHETPRLRVRAGVELDISLYMKVEKAGGVEHWRLGQYPFAPVGAPGQGTSVQASIELSTKEICSLKVRDHVSGQPMTLPFKDDIREHIGEPEVLYIPDPSGFPAEVRKELEEAMASGEFPATDVDRNRDEALTYQRVVQQAINDRRQLPPDLISHFQKLTELLPKVAQGKPIKVDSAEAKVYQEMLINKAELIKILRNISFQY
jgi:hypothetical protein